MSNSQSNPIASNELDEICLKAANIFIRIDELKCEKNVLMLELTNEASKCFKLKLEVVVRNETQIHFIWHGMEPLLKYVLEKFKTEFANKNKDIGPCSRTCTKFRANILNTAFFAVMFEYFKISTLTEDSVHQFWEQLKHSNSLFVNSEAIEFALEIALASRFSYTHYLNDHNKDSFFFKSYAHKIGGALDAHELLVRVSIMHFLVRFRTCYV
jgi:hypothetical protein